MGRLFDAVAALLGGRRRVTYEGQAAIELEALARSVPRRDAPAYDGLCDRTDVDSVAILDPAPLVRALLEDHAHGTASPLLAAGFHEAIGRAAAALAVQLARTHALDTVVLTGGVFQNVRLTEVVEETLRDEGIDVLVHQRVPPNDGGISIGQAAIAARARGR